LEINLIKTHFPSSLIINPSKFTNKWNQLGLSENEIMDECYSLVKKSDIVIFFGIKNFIPKGVFDEITFAEKNNKIIFLSLE
jgi:hypothetical protein